MSITKGKRLVTLFAVTFFVILPLLCRHLKHSIYFQGSDGDTETEILMKANSERLQEARSYFEMLRSKPERFRNDTERKPGGVNVSVVIVSVSRDRNQSEKHENKYLIQNIWRFLQLLNHTDQDERFPHKVSLSVCNVDNDPATFVEAEYVSRFVPIFQRFHNKYIPKVHEREKEKSDYVFCLNRAMEDKDADYFLLVEDDALPKENFFHVLDYTIRMHLERKYVRGEFHPSDKSIAFVKFYHPERLLSFWSLNVERIPELFAITILITSLLMCRPIYGIISRCCDFRPGYSSPLIILAIASIFSFLIVSAIGRPNFLELRRFLPTSFHIFVPTASCCIPAVLYPRKGATEVIEHLNSISCGKHYAKDTALDEITSKKGMKAYLVQPNSFTHIGLYSSVRNGIINPFFMETA